MTLSTLDVNVGKELVFNIDVAKAFAHADVEKHIVYLGFRNALMDSHASAVRKDFETDAAYLEASRAMVAKKLEALYEGSVRTRSTVAGPTAFEKVMVRVALGLLSKEKRKELAAMEDKGAAFIDAVIEKNREKIEALANKAIAEAEAKAKENEELAKGLDLDIEL